MTVQSCETLLYLELLDAAQECVKRVRAAGCQPLEEFPAMAAKGNAAAALSLVQAAVTLSKGTAESRRHR